MVGRDQQGFTLVELVVILILLGILAVTAASRLSTGGFDEVRFRDELITSLRGAQQRAMQNTLAQVCFTFDYTTPAYGPPTAECGTDIDSASVLSSPSGDDSLAANGMLFSSSTGVTSIRFSGLGVALNAADNSPACGSGCQLAITGESQQQVCIEPEGYIHEGTCD